MMVPTKGLYYCDSSDLLVSIQKIYIMNKEAEKPYIKVKLFFMDKSFNPIVDEKRQYKLYLEDIQHWKKFHFV